MASDTKDKAEVYTERTDIRAGLTRHPEDSQIAFLIKLKELGLVDGTNTELTLDSGDEWWALEESTSQGLDSARESGSFGKGRMETKNSNVLLSCNSSCA